MFLDTSVVVAALRSERGAAAEVVRRIVGGEGLLLLDLKLFLEYCAVCYRPEHVQSSGLSGFQIAAFLKSLEDTAEPVHVTTSLRPLLRDPDDEMVVELAVAGHADVIVTNNIKDLLPAYTLFGIRVVRPAEFLVG